MRRNKISNYSILKMTIVVGLFLSGLILLLLSNYLSEFGDFKLYLFEINADYDSQFKLVLNNFHFFYDFTESRGNMSFHIGEKYNVSSIRIELPDILRKENVNVLIKKDDEDGDCLNLLTKNRDYKVAIISNSVNNPKYSDIILKFAEAQENICPELFFYSSIKPTGAFIFNKGNLTTYSNEHIRLNLGKNYRCFTDCIGYSRNIEINRNTIGKIISLNFEEEKESHSFNLNTLNEFTLFLKQSTLAFGVSLWVGLVLFLLLNETLGYAKKTRWGTVESEIMRILKRELYGIFIDLKNIVKHTSGDGMGDNESVEEASYRWNKESLSNVSKRAEVTDYGKKILSGTKNLFSYRANELSNIETKYFTFLNPTLIESLIKIQDGLRSLEMQTKIFEKQKKQSTIYRWFKTDEEYYDYVAKIISMIFKELENIQEKESINFLRHRNEK